MIITRGYAKRLIRQGKAVADGYTVDQGWTWAIIRRDDQARYDHVRLVRTTAQRAVDVAYWGKF